MGETAAQTVREIEQTRGRLDAELRELEQRLPAPARWVKRLGGVAVGGGATGALFWFAVRRVKARREAKAERRPIQTVVRVLPERWADSLSGTLEDGRWKSLAGLGVGAWVLFRIAELRQLRRMNRALIASGRAWGPGA
jgi:hypothetical protein